MLKLDGATGEVLWFQTYASPNGSNESAFAIACDSYGDPILVGRSNSATDLDQILVILFAAWDGSIVWMREIDGGHRLDDRAWDIVVGPDDDPVVTAMATRPDGSADFVTIKLDGWDGTTLWTRSEPGGTGNLDERSGWLELCDDGDVIMANRTWGPTTSTDVVVHRYDGTDGSVVWARQFGAGGTVGDDPRDLARDAAGDLLIAGVSAGDYMVLKIHEEDGSLAWWASYDGPPGWYDAGRCVLEGPNGEIVACGYSTGESTSWDAVTVGFAPEDGSLLWEQRFDAGDALTDEAGYLALGPQGELFVVGYAYGQQSDADLMTLRYELGVTSSACGGPDASGGLTAGPNPFSTRVVLEATTDAAGPARLEVFDAAGRVVATLWCGDAEPGGRRFEWDGRGANGAPVPAGTYFARLQGPGTHTVRRIVRIR